MKLFYRTFIWIILTVIAVWLVTAIMMRLNSDRALEPTAEQERFIAIQQRILERRLERRSQGENYDSSPPPRLGFGPMRGWTLPADDELAEGPTVFFRARGKWVAGPIPITDGENEWAAFVPVPPELARQLQLSQWLALSPWWALAMLALLSSCSYVLARQLSRPITELERQAQPMTQGEFGIPINNPLVSRSDEVGVLAKTLNNVSLAAREALAAQQRLLADVSHELRSPLGRIGMAASLMQRKQGDSVEIERIQHEVQQLNALVGELLELSRDSMIQHQQAQTPCSLTQLIQDTANDYALNERQIQIDTKLPADDIEIHASPAVLRKIIHNLMDNAVRYASHTVYLELQRAEHHVTILVADDGKGVSEAHFEDLFKPFFRPEDARERASGGVGLGLAIVKSATTMLGGEVTLSRARQGGLAVAVKLL